MDVPTAPETSTLKLELRGGGGEGVDVEVVFLVGGLSALYSPIAGARRNAVGGWDETRWPLAASALPAELETEKRHSHRTTTDFAHLSQRVWGGAGKRMIFCGVLTLPSAGRQAGGQVD